MADKTNRAESSLLPYSTIRPPTFLTISLEQTLKLCVKIIILPAIVKVVLFYVFLDILFGH